MYIVKKIIVKSTVTLFVSAASIIGTQAGLTIWSNGLGDKFENKYRQLFKKKEEFA